MSQPPNFTPETDRSIKDKTSTAVTAAVEEKSSAEASSKLPPPTYHQPRRNPWWVWLLALLVALGIGLMAGRYWGQQQAEVNQINTHTLESSEATQSNGPSLVMTEPVTEDTTPTVGQKPVLTVEIVTPQQSMVTNALSADGSIVPKDIATVFGKVNGVTLEQVMVQEGERVKQGQVLAVFDTEAMRQRQRQAQADLAEAQTRLALAKADADRVLPLLEIDAVSQQEADRYVATANQAAASVEAAKARLNNQSVNLKNAKVIAPVAGIISSKNANVGSIPGAEPLFTIIENGILQWQAKVDPNKLGDIHVGTPVQVSLPNNKSVMGEVSRIAPVADKGSRQVSVFATLANSPQIRAGMYQRGTFVLGSKGEQILPISAVVSDDGYDYVMLVNRNQDATGQPIYQIKKHKLQLAERQGDWVVVADPLPKDVAVVRQGGGFLNDGDVVRVAGLEPLEDNQSAANTNHSAE